MEFKKSWYLLIAIVCIVIILIIPLVFIYIRSKALNSEISGGCKVLNQNFGNKKIDIVFLSDNTEENTAKEYVDFFLNSTPFSQNRDKINFFYAGNTSCKNMNNFIFCYSKETLKKSSACPNDYVIVLTNQSASVRSSAYMNLISLNINNRKNVILHEFGHVFANLADEYVPSIIPFGAKNCRKTCSDFRDVESCFIGCSETDYSRSSYDSVMRNSKISDYKKLNTLLIENNLNKYE